MCTYSFVKHLVREIYEEKVKTSFKMMLTVCVGIGVSVALCIYRAQVKKALVTAHYEAIYWLLGGAAMMEDILYARKNVLKDLPNRSNEIAVVTGGSRGIGLEVVKKLLQCDMHVIIGCRRVQAGLDAIASLRLDGVTSGSAEVLQLDTSSLKSVEKFATEVLSKISQLHLLINNAGIMFVPHSLTEDGFESQLGVNYMGHVLLIHLLLPIMKETGKNSPNNARIVHVSSCAHIPGSIDFDDINFLNQMYIPSKAYAQSKLAQLMFSNALDRRLKDEGARVCSISVHPGIVNTELFDGTPLKRIAPWMPKLFFKTPEQGSRSIVFSALSPSLEGRGGIYVSNCRETWISSTAKDVSQQERLMSTTMEMLNIKDIGNPK